MSNKAFVNLTTELSRVLSKRNSPIGCCEDYANYNGCNCVEEAKRQDAEEVCNIGDAWEPNYKESK